MATKSLPRRGKAHPRTRRKPVSCKSLEAIKARLSKLREGADQVPPALATALGDIRDKLSLIESTAIVVEHALLEGSTPLDEDAAVVLRRLVGDELDRQVERIDLLLGRPARDLGWDGDEP